MAEIKLVGGDVLISAEPEIEAILQAHTRAAWWLRRLVTDVLVPAAENPESGKWSFPNKMQVIHLADRFGKKLGEFVNRLDAWDDAKALFEVLALVILSNRDYELLTALASGLAMVYGQLSRKDRRLLAGIAGGKPVYRMVEIADQVSPQNMLLFTRLMRERLPHAFAGSEEAVGDAAIAAFNWVLRHSATLTLALTWPFFDEHTIDVFPEKIAGASVLLTPPAQSDVNEAMRDALARRRYVLPPTGVTVIPPENTARVERLVVWERGSWVVGCLKHGSGAGSLVLARPSMPACISLWTMMTEKGTPVSNDPLAALVADAYYDLVTVSEAKLARRSRRTEGEAREARRSERKGVQSYWYVPRILKEEELKEAAREGEGDRKEGRLRSLIPRRVAPHAVSGHLRRLTGTRKAASEAAKEAARQAGLEIPAGYTFVRPYVTGQTEKEKQVRPGRPVAKKRRRE